MKKQQTLFLTIVSCFWFAQYVYIPYQTPFLTSLGISSSMIGIIVGAYGISQMLLRLPVGVLADQAGRHKRFILTGCLCSGIASIFRIFLPNAIGFLIANLFSGMASAMWISFMVFFTNSYPKDKQAQATGKIVLFNNLGMFLGFIISTLCYSHLGMKYLCIFSILGGGFAFLLGLFIKEERPEKNNLSAKYLLSICSNKRLWMFAFIALIQQGIQMSTTMSFTTQILKDCGASNGMVGLSSMYYMLTAVCFAAFASSKFCAKKGPKFWIPTVLLCICCYCIFVPRITWIPGIFLLQTLPGMATGILFSYATSEAMAEVPAEQKSTAMGFFQAFYAIGMTLLPILTGNIASSIHMQTAYLFLAFIALAGFIMVKVFYKNKRNKLI